MERYSPEAAAQRAAHVHHEIGSSEPSVPAEPPGPPGSAALLAMTGYLGVIFFSFIPPLVIYLVRRSYSEELRFHAARAFNMAITMIIYDLSAVIAGALLSFDTVELTLYVVVPLTTALWLVMLGYLIALARSAARGERRGLPEGLCVPLLRMLCEVTPLSRSGRGSPRRRAAARTW
jgi:hypothetical protein